MGVHTMLKRINGLDPITVEIERDGVVSEERLEWNRFTETNYLHSSMLDRWLAGMSDEHIDALLNKLKERRHQEVLIWAEATKEKIGRKNNKGGSNGKG